jgi:aryl sulfotransferase
MGTLQRYRTLVADSSRWDGFQFREGDIVISTPPKCGTTWTQMICALLIFGTADFDRSLDLISPWLDMNTRPIESVVADLDAQTHRRFIKSHTPLDGLPFDERVTYITVGRDPRDVAMSMAHHFDNMNFEAFFSLIDKAVGLETLTDVMAEESPPAVGTPIERFWGWVEGETKPGQSVSGLPATLHHLETFWDVRDRPNIVLLHYGDLKADLPAEMRRLAARLGIAIDDDAIPALAQEASFEQMRASAGRVAPNTTELIWKDAQGFFHSGQSGQWRDLLGPYDLQRYAGRVADLIPSDLADWVHQGPIV